MKGNVFDKIRIAEYKYLEYMLACDGIVIEAQKHIDWNNDISCEYYPGDGVCLMIEEQVCPASIFFELVEESENGMVDENTYMKNCI